MIQREEERLNIAKDLNLADLINGLPIRQQVQGSPHGAHSIQYRKG